MTAIMCARFTASFEFREIKIRFRLQSDLPSFARRYNIAPSQEVPLIVQNGGVNELKRMRWGLVRSWASDRSIANRMINVRAETISEKSSLRRLIERRRCLIPADGFYEWRREGNNKIPVWFHLKKKEPFAFAGLWDISRDVKGEMLHSFTIITTVPNTLLRGIHNRMPVMFDPLQGKQWLDPRLSTRAGDIAAVLAPFPSELMESHDVSPLVNKPEFDSADCIIPISDAQLRLV
ncbi:MAG TPA: SOS response-associated peptidase [Candidatus Binatia bacterium]